MTSRLSPTDGLAPLRASVRDLLAPIANKTNEDTGFRLLLGTDPEADVPGPPRHEGEKIGWPAGVEDPPTGEPAPDGEDRAALEPLARSLALERAGVIARSASSAREEASGDLGRLLERLVKRIGWGSAGRRAALRLELDGAYAGLAITVIRDAGELRVELCAPPGRGARELARDLEARLIARGHAVREVRVTAR